MKNLLLLCTLMAVFLAGCSNGTPEERSGTATFSNESNRTVTFPSNEESSSTIRVSVDTDGIKDKAEELRSNIEETGAEIKHNLDNNNYGVDVEIKTSVEESNR